jgi:hypothetical protein
VTTAKKLSQARETLAELEGKLAELLSKREASHLERKFVTL